MERYSSKLHPFYENITDENIKVGIDMRDCRVGDYYVRGYGIEGHQFVRNAGLESLKFYEHPSSGIYVRDWSFLLREWGIHYHYTPPSFWRFGSIHFPYLQKCSP